MVYVNVPEMSVDAAIVSHTSEATSGLGSSCAHRHDTTVTVDSDGLIRTIQAWQSGCVITPPARPAAAGGCAGRSATTTVTGSERGKLS